MAADLVRVYIPESDMDVSVARGLAVGRGLEVLDKPAVDRHGRTIPPKKHQPLGAPTNTPRRSGRQADEATSNTEANKEATP